MKSDRKKGIERDDETCEKRGWVNLINPAETFRTFVFGEVCHFALAPSRSVYRNPVPENLSESLVELHNWPWLCLITFGHLCHLLICRSAGVTDVAPLELWSWRNIAMWLVNKLSRLENERLLSCELTYPFSKHFWDFEDEFPFPFGGICDRSLAGFWGVIYQKASRIISSSPAFVSFLFLCSGTTTINFSACCTRL